LEDQATLDPSALDAPGKQPTALAVSAERTRRRIMYNLDEVQAAILNHTALKLAKTDSPEHFQTLLQRSQQIGGMLELARRLNDHRLVRFLEAHKDALTRLIEAE
jgi:hypothetical protein